MGETWPQVVRRMRREFPGLDAQYLKDDGPPDIYEEWGLIPGTDIAYVAPKRPTLTGVDEETS